VEQARPPALQYEPSVVAVRACARRHVSQAGEAARSTGRALWRSFRNSRAHFEQRRGRIGCDSDRLLRIASLGSFLRALVDLFKDLGQPIANFLSGNTASSPASSGGGGLHHRLTEHTGDPASAHNINFARINTIPSMA